VPRRADRSPPSRTLGELTSPEVSRYLKETSILCLPVGAIEQHGPHLPLNTDVIVADELTRRIVSRWGDAFDLWQLPTVAIGLSREHDWAPGTLSLPLEGFVALVDDIVHELARSLPARNLVIVNGHGGNRGVLENLVRELRGDCGVNACVIHPLDLSKAAMSSSYPDVHGGEGETSVMLALAPKLVRRDQIGRAPKDAPDPKAIAAFVFDRGTTWPWRTDDARLAQRGVIGEAAAASRKRGERIVESIVAEARAVLERLLQNQRSARDSGDATAFAQPAVRNAQASPRARRRALRARTSTHSENRRRPRPPGRS
jgi:creatinine amidohydrolase